MTLRRLFSPSPPKRAPEPFRASPAELEEFVQDAIRAFRRSRCDYVEFDFFDTETDWRHVGMRCLLQALLTALTTGATVEYARAHELFMELAVEAGVIPAREGER